MLTDIEVVANNLTTEYLGIDSEYDLLRKLLPELYSGIEQGHFIVDSMPLEICKPLRSSCNKICRDSSYRFPHKGYCSSQPTLFYGYKLLGIGCFSEHGLTRLIP